MKHEFSIMKQPKFRCSQASPTSAPSVSFTWPYSAECVLFVGAFSLHYRLEHFTCCYITSVIQLSVSCTCSKFGIWIWIMEQGTPTVRVDTKKSDYRHSLECLDFAARHVETWRKRHNDKTILCDWGSPGYKGTTVCHLHAERTPIPPHVPTMRSSRRSSRSARHWFLCKCRCVMNFECSQLSLSGIGNGPRVLSVPHAGQAALTIFNE